MLNWGNRKQQYTSDQVVQCCMPHFQSNMACLFRWSVYGVEPDFTREGGSIPVTLTFQDLTGKNVMLLPMGACDDGAHSQNEKINKTNYLQGVGLTKGLTSCCII